jgi:hypothetical protein
LLSLWLLALDVTVRVGWSVIVATSIIGIRWLMTAPAALHLRRPTIAGLMSAAHRISFQSVNWAGRVNDPHGGHGLGAHGAAGQNRSWLPSSTYASLTVDVNNPRWAGVPFTLRSGKAVNADSAEIAIHFRRLPQYLVAQWPGVEPNALRIGLTEPYVRLATALNGPDRTAESRELEARSTPPRFTAYAHLIQEMLKGDPMLFITSEEAEEAWRIIDPVMKTWSLGDVPIQEYPAGREPPGPA